MKITWAMAPRWGALIGLSAWCVFAFLFVARSPAGSFNHDFHGHVEYTRFLYREGRLPQPRQGWETHQLPLYYLLNTALSPGKIEHTFYVRLLSVLYGALTLVGLSWCLTHYRIGPLAQAALLTFIATTPTFLFMFTAYTNDSLATAISVVMIAAALSWIDEGRRIALRLFGLFTVAGLYTKLTVVFVLASVVTLLGIALATKRLRCSRAAPLLKAAGLGIVLLLPWLLLRNYRHTGHLAPTGADFGVESQIHLPQSPLRTLFTPPGWTKHEWKDPYVHLWESENHKKNSFGAFLFASSIFGEYRFDYLPPMLPWAITLSHAILWLVSLFHARQSSTGKRMLALLILGIAYLTSLIFLVPYATYMDFRYIAWLWLPLACLSSAAFVAAAPWTRVFRVFVGTGIALQGFFWFMLVLGGQWNIP